MSKENVVLCYEGVQRVYRNAMVKFLRERMKQAFGAKAAEKMRQAVPWDKERENTMLTRASGELSNLPQDDFDILGVNHFYNLFDLYYEDLCPNLPELPEPQLKQQRQTLLTWLKTVKTLRDPMSHPIEEDFSIEDSFQFLDCARRVLQRLQLEGPANEIKQMMQGLFSSAQADPSMLADSAEPLDDRLPPKESIVVEFVGRTRELSELWSWFDDAARRRWALAGEGGKGKSALAYTFALDVKLKAPAPFQTVLWLSAKKRQFVEGQVLPIDKPDFSDLDSALVRILEHYGWAEELEQPTPLKRARVLELLSEFPALVIVDDVDSLEGGTENVIEFFSLEVPATKSKVLFTSRRTIFGMGATTTHIGGLSDEDASKFIIARCELMDLDPALFERDIIKRITKTTEGSPLYIEDLMRLVASVDTPAEAVRLWSEREGREARKYALQRECELLSPEAQGILLAACICPGAVSFAEIEAVTGCSSDVVTAALQELQRLFLLPKPRIVKQEQRFDINVNTRTLVSEAFGNTDQYRRLAESHRVISEGIPSTARRGVGGIVRQAIFLIKGGKHTDAESLLLKALERNHSNPDLFGVLGLVYKVWQPQRVTDARARFKRAWQLKSPKAEMYEHWFQMEAKLYEWRKAIEAADNGLKVLPEDRLLLYYAGFARQQLGKELQQGRHYEKAEEYLREAKKMLAAALKNSSIEVAERPFDANIYRTLVFTCELLKDVGAMRHFLKLWTLKHPEDLRAASEWKRLSVRYSFRDSE